MATDSTTRSVSPVLVTRSSACRVPSRGISWVKPNVAAGVAPGAGRLVGRLLGRAGAPDEQQGDDRQCRRTPLRHAPSLLPQSTTRTVRRTPRRPSSMNVTASTPSSTPSLRVGMDKRDRPAAGPDPVVDEHSRPVQRQPRPLGGGPALLEPGLRHVGDAQRLQPVPGRDHREADVHRVRRASLDVDAHRDPVTLVDPLRRPHGHPRRRVVVDQTQRPVVHVGHHAAHRVGLEAGVAHLVVVERVRLVGERDRARGLAGSQVEPDLRATAAAAGAVDHADEDLGRRGQVAGDREGHPDRGRLVPVTLEDPQRADADRRDPLVGDRGQRVGGGGQVEDPDPAVLAVADHVDLGDPGEVDAGGVGRICDDRLGPALGDEAVAPQRTDQPVVGRRDHRRGPLGVGQPQPQPDVAQRRVDDGPQLESPGRRGRADPRAPGRRTVRRRTSSSGARAGRVRTRSRRTSAGPGRRARLPRPQASAESGS